MLFSCWNPAGIRPSTAPGSSAWDIPSAPAQSQGTSKQNVAPGAHRGCSIPCRRVRQLPEEWAADVQAVRGKPHCVSKRLIIAFNIGSFVTDTDTLQKLYYHYQHCGEVGAKFVAARNQFASTSSQSCSRCSNCERFASILFAKLRLVRSLASGEEERPRCCDGYIKPNLGSDASRCVFV